jgi:hypothetical protein
MEGFDRRLRTKVLPFELPLSTRLQIRA